MADGLRATLRSARLAWIALGGSLLLVMLIWTWVRRDVRRSAHLAAERRVARVVSEIRVRLEGYQALAGEAAARVGGRRGASAADLEAVLREIPRREGFLDYSALGLCRVEQRIDGPDRCPTLAVIDPRGAGPHQHGLDHFSSPERAEALRRAAATGMASLSAPLRLMVDPPQGLPGSVMLYLPCDAAGRKTMVRSTPREFVFLAIPLARFAEGVWSLQDDATALDILDVGAGAPVFRSPALASGEASHPSLDASAEVEVAGRRWRVSSLPVEAFFNRGDIRSPDHVLAFGCLVSLLTFLVALLLESGRSRAQQLAREMAGEARENEARLREIAETMGEGLYVVDPLGTILFVNEEAGRILGRDPRTLLGCNAHELFHRQSLDGSRGAAEACGILRVARTGGRYVSDEEVYWHQEDRAVSVAVNASPVLRQGIPDGAVVVFRDISEQKRAEADLEERNAWVRAMLDVPSFQIWIKDREGRYMAVNRTFARSFGPDREPEAIVGCTDADLVPAERAGVFASLDREVLATRRANTQEERIEGPDGPRWRETVRTPILGRDGEVYGVAGLSRDITDRKQVAWALGHAQKLESLELMAGGIAHDFNNLFQALMGNLELAQAGVTSGSSAAACLRRMEDILARAARLSGEMLLYSGRSHPHQESLDLAALARRVSAGRRVELEVGASLPPLEGDPIQIGKLLAILLENASEAAGEGPVRLRIQAVDLRPEDLGTGYWPEPGRSEPSVRIEVEDGGPGMPPDVLGRMFDPFFSTKAMGRGLGLPAALGILRGHHGQIQVVSQPGRGTQVRVYLPVRSGVREAARPADAPSAVKGTLLVVDDDAEVRRSMSELIRTRLGFEVLEASSGEEALALFEARHDRIDLILMDATMPTLDGPSTFRALRRIHPGARAILCSGYGEEVGRAAATEHGFAAFLHKPFSLRDLEGLLAQHLAGR